MRAEVFGILFNAVDSVKPFVGLNTLIIALESVEFRNNVCAEVCNFCAKGMTVQKHHKWNKSRAVQKLALIVFGLAVRVVDRIYSVG